MGKQRNCGVGISLPTAPAWSFGHKCLYHKDPHGPGGGKYGVASTLGTNGYIMGGRHSPNKSRPETLQSTFTDPGHVPDGPFFTFGGPLPAGYSKVPGPGTYNTADRATQKAIYGNSWGPPARPRVPNAPAPAIFTYYNPRDTRLGPTMGLPRPLNPQLTPSPQDYQPFCSFGCRACDHYQGPTFGIRHHEHPNDIFPAPIDYHVGCSTLGYAVPHDCCNDLPHRKSVSQPANMPSSSKVSTLPELKHSARALRKSY